VNQYRGNLGGGVFEHNYNWWDPYSTYTSPNDGNGHGTHTMGTMVGDDGAANQIGMAPEAEWIACRGCSTSSCTDTALLSCAQFVAAPWDLSGQNSDPDKRPQVVNNSWGDCGQSYDNWYQGVVDNWHAFGVYPVFSNGNNTNCGYSAPPGLNTVGNPARYGNVTGVGSTGQSNGAYANHSNWGPTDNPDTINPNGYPSLKPQVLAPGVGIRSSVIASDTAYASYTGTSMSAPHVAGLLALVWQAAPCLVGDYAATETLLEMTAVPIPYASGGSPPPGPGNVPNYATGWGEIDALAAVNAALGVCGDAFIEGVVTSAATSNPIAGATVTVDDGVDTRTVTTAADGSYSLAVFAGTYDITVTAFGYLAGTATVEVETGETVVQNFALAMAPSYTITGYVFDSLTDWPLYSRISVTGAPVPDFWTDPVTGEFSITLPAGMEYGFTANPVVAGYLPETVSVGPLAADIDVDFEVEANLVICNAPGYSISSAYSEFFDTSTAPALPSGWAWLRTNGTAGEWATRTSTRYPAGQPPQSAPNLVFYNSYSVSSGSARLYQTAGMDMTAFESHALTYWMYHDTGYTSSNDRVQLQVSVDGGTSWIDVGAPVSRYDGSVGWKMHGFDLSAYATATNLRLGFHAISAYGNDTHIDSLAFGASCSPQPGGLVVGQVLDENTGGYLPGSVVSGPAGSATAVVTADPNVGDAFFTVFAPASSQSFTVSLPASRYGSVSEPVTVLSGSTVEHDFYLPAGILEVAPAELIFDVPMGFVETTSLTAMNVGGEDLTFEILEKDLGFSPTIMAGEDVLVVRYDTTAAAALEGALNTLGITFLGVTDTVYRAMTVDALLEYQAVFYMGVVPIDSIPTTVAYLDAGGSLFIADNDLGWSRGTTPFYQTYLQATYNVDNAGDILTGQDFMTGLALNVATDPYPDGFTVGAEGTSIFQWDATSYAGGVAVERNDYKAIYLAFDFQYLTDVSMRVELLERVAGFLLASDVPWLSVDPVEGEIMAGGNAAIEVTLDATAVTIPGDYLASLTFKNNTPYGKVVVPVTMSVTPPASYGKLNGTVTGLGYCDENPAALAGAVVLVESASQTWELETDAAGYYQLWLDESHSPLSVSISFPGYFGEDFAGVVMAGGVITTVDAALYLDAPCVDVDPASLSDELYPNETSTQDLFIYNGGAGVLDWEIFEMEAMLVELNNSALPEGAITVDVPDGNIWLAERGRSESTPAPGPDALAPVALVLDDGAAENGIGLTAGGQFLWLNRFTPTPDSFPFTLTEVRILFRTSDFVNVGELVDVYIYQDADGDPANGAVHVASFNNLAVQALDSWSVYNLATPVFLTGPGDVLIAVVNRTAGVTAGTYPASIDQTSSQGRSWIGLYTGNPGDPPVLPADSAFGIIDSFGFPGNWMVRGYGQTGGSGVDIPWVSVAPVFGSADAYTFDTVQVTFDSTGLTVGTHTAQLMINSNDPIFPAVFVPLTLEVLPTADFGLLKGVVTGLGHCEENPVPLEGAVVYIESGEFNWTVVTDASGYYEIYLNQTLSPFEVTVSYEAGYLPETITGVEVVGEQETVLDVDLRLYAPCIEVEPLSLEAFVGLGSSETLPVTITNNGAAPLTFQVKERDNGFSPTYGPFIEAASETQARPVQPLSNDLVTERGTASGPAPELAPAGPAPEDIGTAWETMAPLPSGRVFNAVIADENGYIYAIGGTSDGGAMNPTSTNYRYDTAANTWTTMAPMPGALDSIDGAVINNKIYIPGGASSAVTYVYDIASDTWASIPANGGYTPRSQYQVVTIATDLYVLGGIVASASASTTEVWKLDTTTGVWSASAPMQKSRTSFSAAAIDGSIYVAGGVLFPGFTPDMTSEKFDGVSWSYIAPVPSGGGAYTRWSYNADGHGADGLWLAAGRRDAGWAVLDHAGYYNPETDTWTTSPTIPIMAQGRVYVEGAVAADGYFYVIGGRDSAGAIAYANNERLYVGAPAGADVPWLSASPEEGEVLADGDWAVVEVTLSAVDLTDPGLYQATLSIRSNDTFNSTIDIPVSLNVLHPAEFGKLEGFVTGLGLCDQNPVPLEGAVVYIESSDGETNWTLASAADGYYSLWLDEVHSPVVVTVSYEPDYLAQTAFDVEIVAQEVTTLDFDLILNMPCATIEPAEVALTLGQDTLGEAALTISNLGAAGFEWSIAEEGEMPASLSTFSEGFEDITLLEGQGWVMINRSSPLGVTDWFQGNDTVFPAHAGSATSYIGANFNNTSGVGTISNWLLLPPMMLQNGDELTFYTRIPDGSTWPDRLEVRMSPNGASSDVGDSATSVGDFVTLLLSVNPDLANGVYPEVWTQFTATVEGLSGPTEGRLAFRYFVTNGGPSGSNSNYIGIDTLEFTSYTSPVCASVVDMPWLSVDPDSGVAAAYSSEDVALYFDSTGLDVGTYAGNLCVTTTDPLKPLVVVPVTLEVEEPMSGVDVGNDMEEDGMPGTTKMYTVVVKNVGNMADTFTLSVEGHSWNTELSDTSVYLMPGQEAMVYVSVDVPAGAMAEQWDMTTFKAVSTYDAETWDECLIKTNAMAYYALEMVSDAASASGYPGDQVEFTLTLTNGGNITDTFNLAVSGSEWDAMLSTASIALAPGESGDVTVTVSIPAGAEEGEMDMFTVSAVSAGDPGVFAEVNLTVEALAVPGEAPAASFTAPATAAIDEDVLFTNTTTGTEPISYLWDFGDGVTSTLENPTHAFSVDGLYTVTLTATNDFGTDTVSKSIFIQPALPTHVDLSVDITISPLPVVVGVPTTFTAVVSNLGTAAATGVVVSGTLPATLEFISGENCAVEDGVLTCDLGTIAAGASKTAVVVLKFTAYGAFEAAFEAFGVEEDVDLENNVSEFDLNVEPLRIFVPLIHRN
jgi:uncharacterized repeat protein (TIGR01451 family)